MARENGTGCRLRMTLGLGARAKAYVVFRWFPRDPDGGSPTSDSYRRTFGQTVDGQWGWHTAYIAIDGKGYDMSAAKEDDWGYADIPVYGGCTWGGPNVPGIDISDDFPEGTDTVVYGWDYNHGFTKEWESMDERDVTMHDIIDDIYKAWDVLKTGIPVDMEGIEDCEER